jgi:hypothetical protein
MRRKGRRVATDEVLILTAAFSRLRVLKSKPRMEFCASGIHHLPSQMASHPAIRLAAKSTKSAVGRIYLHCSVKPGASKQREGVVSVSDTVIELCVAAQPKDGAANLSVRKVFSDVNFYSNYEAWCSFISDFQVSKVRHRNYLGSEVTREDSLYFWP